LVQAFERVKESILGIFGALEADLTDGCVPIGGLDVVSDPNAGDYSVHSFSQIEGSNVATSSIDDRIYGLATWRGPTGLDGDSKVVFFK
jgi:hypothetical protein